MAANDDQVVPGKSFPLNFEFPTKFGSVIQNLDLRMYIVDLPESDFVTEIGQILDVDDIGEVEANQLPNKDGQGLYFTARMDDYGDVLIKYLEGGYYRRLKDAYENFGLPADALADYGMAERERTRPRELVHPNIAKVWALISPTGSVEKVTGLIMEGAADGVLETYARNRPLSDAVVRNLGRQGASAISYCHGRRVMHRDIRPRNFYVHNGGTVLKLGNFGYAKKGGQVLNSANRGDEVWYKAPEIIGTFNLADYSYPVDVYSFGLTLWSMTHEGTRPYRDEGVAVHDHSRFKQYLKVDRDSDEDVTHRPTIRPNLDERLGALMRRCWVTNPAERPRIDDVEATLQ